MGSVRRKNYDIKCDECGRLVSECVGFRQRRNGCGEAAITRLAVAAGWLQTESGDGWVCDACHDCAEAALH